MVTFVLMVACAASLGLLAFGFPALVSLFRGTE